MTTRVLALLAMIVLVPGCEQERHRELQGYLYFAAGSYLGRFDLSDASSSAALNLGDVSIQQVGPIDARLILATLKGSIDRGPVPRIVQVDIDSHQVVDLFGGNAAWYVPDGKFFLIDDGRRITARGRRSDSVTDIVILEHGYNVRVPLVTTGGTDVLYERNDESGSMIHVVDVATGRDNPLPTLTEICTLDGAVWLSGEQQLLCRRRDSGPAEPVYVSVPIDADDPAPFALPDARSLRALVYLAGQDAVLFTAIQPGFIGGAPKNQVWFSDLRDGTSHLLSADQFLGETVAWSDR